MFHPKITILSLITHQHVVEKLYDVFSSVEHEDILRNVTGLFAHTVEVSGYFKIHSFSFHRRKKVTQVWNDAWVILGWNTRLNS